MEPSRALFRRAPDAWYRRQELRCGPNRWPGLGQRKSAAVRQRDGVEAGPVGSQRKNLLLIDLRRQGYAREEFRYHNDCRSGPGLAQDAEETTKGSVPILPKGRGKNNDVAFIALNAAYEEGLSAAIIVGYPSEVVARIRTPMPVIIRASHHQAWIDPITTVEEACELMKPLDERVMTAYEVGLAVNRISNDEPGCIAPLVSAELATLSSGTSA